MNTDDGYLFALPILSTQLTTPNFLENSADRVSVSQQTEIPKNYLHKKDITDDDDIGMHKILKYLC